MDRKMKRLFLLVIFLLVLSGVWVSPFPVGDLKAAEQTPVEAVIKELQGLSGEARLRKLLEWAKKEGKVVFYSSMTLETLRVIERLFEKTYPGVDLDAHRIRAEVLVERILSEARARTYMHDVHSGGTFGTLAFHRMGLLARYRSPELAAMLEGFYDSGGLWASDLAYDRVLAYNTTLVQKQQLPQRIEDLLDPQWRGQIGVDQRATVWFDGMLQAMGKEKGLEFMRELAKHGIRWRRGHSLVTQLLAAGEFKLAPELYAKDVEEMRQKRAPVDFVRVGPRVIGLHPMSVARFAPRPYGAILFYDFMLSKEIQQWLAKEEFFPPIRRDVSPANAKLVIKGRPGVDWIALDPIKDGDRAKEIERAFKETMLR